jgi:hypothetical protein
VTYKELKVLIGGYLLGDNVIPTEAELIDSFVYNSMKEVAKVCEPLSLLVSDRSYKVLSFLGDGVFVRYPNAPKNDNDVIDIDDELCNTVALLSASLIASERRKIMLQRDYEKSCMDYNWNRYKDEELLDEEH